LEFVELHFHLLPDVDDGPRTAQESVALAAAAVADGTRTVVVTPHVHPAHITDPTEIAEHVHVLSGRLEREQIELSLLPGGELEHSMVERLSQRDLSLIAHGPPGRRWLLVEAPFDGLGVSFTAATDELRARGFGVVVAHPERAERSRSTDAALEHELTRGSAFQLTASSLTGANGDSMRATAFRLLAAAPLAVIASDAHGLHRMPALRRAVAALAAAEVADPQRFAGAAPRRLLEHGLVPGLPAIAA
jgi:protein-tyrosine phosphatase